LHQIASFILLTLIATLAVGPALGQELEVDIDNQELGSGYAHIISFAAEPEIAAATFNIDDPEGTEDQELKTMKLPLYKEFESDTHDWHWFAQGALSYMNFEQNLFLSSRESIRFKWEGFGALVEGGAVLPLGQGFSLAPSLGVGINRLESDARFSSQMLEDLFSPALGGVLYNWDSLASIARANLGLKYDNRFGNYRYKGNANVSISNIDSFNESRDFPGFSSHASTFSIKLDVSHPLNLSVRDHPLYVIGHLGNTTFVGRDRDILGFSSFSEIGASLGVAKLTLGAMAILGDDVSGWTVIFNYDY
jgi:hypothetical protein